MKFKDKLMLYWLAYREPFILILFLSIPVGFIPGPLILTINNANKIKQTGIRICAPDLYIENENKSVCDKSFCQTLIVCFSPKDNKQYFILENNSK